MEHESLNTEASGHCLNSKQTSKTENVSPRFKFLQFCRFFYYYFTFCLV